MVFCLCIAAFCVVYLVILNLSVGVLRNGLACENYAYANLIYKTRFRLWIVQLFANNIFGTGCVLAIIFGSSKFFIRKYTYLNCFCQLIVHFVSLPMLYSLSLSSQEQPIVSQVILPISGRTFLFR